MPMRSRISTSRSDAFVPDREREHAVQALREPFAPAQVAAQHDLGVALGREHLPAARRAPRAARRSCRPRRCRRARPRRPACARTSAASRPSRSMIARRRWPRAAAPRIQVPDGVRAAARHRLRHRVDDRRLSGQVAIERDPSGDAAHAPVGSRADPPPRGRRPPPGGPRGPPDARSGRNAPKKDETRRTGGFA